MTCRKSFNLFEEKTVIPRVNHRLQPWATDKLYHIKWYWVNLATGKNQTHNCSSDSHRLQMQMLIYLPKEHFPNGTLILPPTLQFKMLLYLPKEHFFDGTLILPPTLQCKMLLYLPKEHFLEGPLPGLKAIWYYYIFVYTCCNIFCLY